MKKLKVLFPILLMAILITSCQNDDPLASVKYQIVGFDNSISQIKYNDFNGTSVDVTNLNNFRDGAKKLSVNTLPFTAKLQITVGNATDVNKSYQLKIFVNGKEKANSNLTVQAESSATGAVEFVVEP